MYYSADDATNANWNQLSQYCSSLKGDSGISKSNQTRVLLTRSDEHVMLQTSQCTCTKLTGCFLGCCCWPLPPIKQIYTTTVSHFSRHSKKIRNTLELIEDVFIMAQQQLLLIINTNVFPYVQPEREFKTV